MKAVFLPASDELLNDRSLEDLKFVPFNPEYLVSEQKSYEKKDRKPRNWITPSTYEEALSRLRASAH